MTPLNLLDVFEFLRRHAARLALWGAGFALAGFLVSFLVVPVYVATAVILPPDDDELSAALSLSRRASSGLGALTRLGGSYFTQADVALATLRSRRVHEAVVRQFDLVRAYRVKSVEQAVRQLGANTSIRIGSEGTIAVAVKDRSATRAADMANAFLQELDELNRDFRAGRARRTRLFLENRVATTDSLLRVSERGLAGYQEKKGIFVLSPDSRNAVDAAGSLMTRKIQAEIDIAIARSYASPKSDELVRLEARLDELNRQIGQVPSLAIGGAELVRRVAILQQVLGVLTTQLEEARIREVMDTPTIQLLDRAVAPERRSWPRRSLMAGVGLMLGLAVGLLEATSRRWPLPRGG